MAAPPDWSQLPTELLHQISERLIDSPLYLLRFRSVCSSWRRSSASPFIPIHHFPFNFSPISVHHDHHASTFSLSARTIFLITPPPHPQTQNQTPWLVKIGQDINGRNRLWPPLLRVPDFPGFSCVYDLYHHPVFHLGKEFILWHPSNNVLNLSKAAAVAAAGKQGLLTTLDTQNLALFRCAEGTWSVIPDMPRSYHDYCAFNGRLYAVDSTGRTVSVGSDSALDLVAEPVVGVGGKFLVESLGMLLLVEMHIEDDRVLRFNVYRLDEKEKRWVEMRSLGDRVLFLGEFSCFSASASDLRVGRGNCVIFIDDSFPDGMGVFHLDAGQVSPLCHHPCYSRLFWSSPYWVGDILTRTPEHSSSRN